jgi:uncharacterized ion transporter superfamily protein YfcC
MIYLGSYAGFNVGWGNVFTVGIAHTVAELPMFSGFGVRVFFHIVNLLLTFGFVYLYIRKVKADPTKSLVYSAEEAAQQANHFEEHESMDLRHMICTAIVVISFGAIIYGSLQLKWGIDHYSVVFFMMAVSCGLIGGLGMNGSAVAFVKGCGSMAYAALVIGMARAISVVMTDGKIIDTVVYYLSLPISKYGPSSARTSCSSPTSSSTSSFPPAPDRRSPSCPSWCPWLTSRGSPGRWPSRPSSSATASPTASSPRRAWLWAALALRASPTRST